MSPYAAALEAFRETLEHLDLPAGELADPAVQERLGRRAALLATSELSWSDHLGPLLEWGDVATLLGTVKTRQGVNDLAQRGRLLALPTKSGKRLYPAFQFSGGRTLPGLAELLGTLGASGASPWTQASWFVTPQAELAGETPARHLTATGLDDRVRTAAHRVSARLAA
jgi:hypothetical protein